MSKERIVIASDHAGFEYKEIVAQFLLKEGFEVMDLGTHSKDSVDYPDYIHPLAETIESGKAPKGIIICGSGNGVAITANKHKDVRAAISWNKELAALSRQHNNANVIAIPARFVSAEMAVAMVKVFIETEFEGGRHDRRVSKINI